MRWEDRWGVIWDTISITVIKDLSDFVGAIVSNADNLRTDAYLSCCSTHTSDNIVSLLIFTSNYIFSTNTKPFSELL